MPVLNVEKEIENLKGILDKLKQNMIHAEGRLSAYTDLQKLGIKTLGESVKPPETIYDDDI